MDAALLGQVRQVLLRPFPFVDFREGCLVIGG